MGECTSYIPPQEAYMGECTPTVPPQGGIYGRMYPPTVPPQGGIYGRLTRDIPPREAKEGVYVLNAPPGWVGGWFMS